MRSFYLKRIISLVLCFSFLCVVTGCTGQGPSQQVIKKTIEDKTTTTTTTTGTTEKLPKPSEKLIALTFDDGPYSPVTNKILDTLEKYGAKATFFVVGNRVDTYSSCVKRAVDMGCEIGSHTYSHKRLTKLSPDVIKSEIDKSNAAIKKVTGSDISLVRPPEGAIDDNVRKYVNYPLAMWSVDSDDWKYRNCDKDCKSVKGSVFDGCVILMHDLYPASAEAVEKLVPELLVEGYKFVTFSQLMEIRGVKMKNGTGYSRAKQVPVETAAPVSSKNEES